MKKLTKYFSRQGYPLFFCYVWAHSDTDGFDKWVRSSIKKLVIHQEEERDKVHVWYDEQEIVRLDNAIAEKIAADPEWFPRVKKDFDRYWNILNSYNEGERVVNTPAELKEYYNTWLAWWPPMAIYFEIPNIESIDQEIRDAALQGRTDTQEFSEEGDEVIETFFKESHPHLLPHWQNMTPDEMFRVEQLTRDEINQIEQRQHGWALINAELMSLKQMPEKLTELDLEFEEVPNENVTEIKGQTACPGKVTGRVKLILEHQHIVELKEGEILVTEMTTPEFVPAMQKAAAIVTDEGGVTCHAAIVARELGKPCIIGTKVATQVLKDGDVVEVNADSAVVKPVSKTNK